MSFFSFTNIVVDQNLAAETAAYLTTKHPDYAILAARIAVSNLHKETKKSFTAVIKDLYHYGDAGPKCCEIDVRTHPFYSEPEEWSSRWNDIQGDL